MVIAYARVSTENQKLDRQIDSLKSAGAEKLFTEKVTGRNTDVPVITVNSSSEKNVRKCFRPVDKESCHGCPMMISSF